MTRYEELLVKQIEKTNVYTMMLMAFGLILVAVNLPLLAIYAQEPGPVDQFAKIEGIITTALIVIGAVLTILAKYLEKYKKGAGAVATTALNFNQKLLENISDFTLVLKVLNTTTGGKVQQELERNGASIDMFDDKLKIGVEQFEILKPLLLKYLGENVDPNKKDLPRENLKPTRVFPPATGTQPVK